MNNTIYATVLCCSMLFSVAQGAVNYPYPQAKDYGNSTINTTAANASATLKTKFEDFKTRFYTEGNCSGTNDCARIRFDNADQTVSEGIAYGMLMMVYFSETNKSYQTEFDKLWKYYQKWKNPRGLMSWKIDGFSKVSGDENASNSASDAEFDVGVALVMAYYQFGDQKYLTDAQALIATIRQQEISPNNLHKPGAEWDSERNPSYISPAAFGIFKEVEPLSTSKDKWQAVITANYTLLTANQSKASSGLFSDWCSDDGTPTSKGTNYSYDAARVPWRLAWANAWFGHSEAKTLLGKVVTFLGSKGPTSTGFDGNATFVGPFTNAFSVSSSNQSKMNDYWTQLMSFSGASYYNSALQVLTGLLASGNMPNLKKLKGDNCCTGSGTTSGTQIDKLEFAANETDDERNYARTWEPWYVFTDASSNNNGDGRGGSTIGNETFKNIVYNKETKQCEEITDYKVVMKDGNDWVVKINNYKLDSIGNNTYYKWNPYATIGLDAVNNGKTGTGGYNLSACTGGFKYKYKGAAHNFKAQLKTVKDFNYHKMEVSTASTDWKDVLVPTGELSQENWGPDNTVKVDFDLSLIEAFSWEVKSGLSTKTGSLAVKDFHCIGGTLTFPSTRPESQCNSGGTSSSSKGSSSSAGASSSSAGSNGSSSSSSSLGSSSSGSNNSSSSVSSSSARSSSSNNGSTPIVLPQIAQNLENNATIQVFDLKGNRMAQLSNLPKGLYIVKVTSASQKRIFKVVVK